ncbi:BCAS1 protein, partial [Sapayoa aenigma]|nr:BCAS1 protein [Sapayoa aenigma]
MGNTLSVPEEAEEDNSCTVKSYQALSDSPDAVRNGSVVFAQPHSPAVNGEVDAKASVARDNVAVSSAETMEQSAAAEAGGQSLGNAARNALPSAKSRSVFAFSWAVPGRTGAPARDSALRAAQFDVSPVSPGANKAPSESAEIPEAAVPEGGSHKNLSQAPPAAPLQDVELTAHGTPEGQDVAAPKPKPVTFLDRIFRLEKGKDGSTTHGGPQASDVPNGSIAAAGLQSTSSGEPQGKASASEIDDCKHQEPREDCAGVPSPTAAHPDGAQVKQESPQAAAAGDNPVMSFLKTLVSPSKAEAKSDSEDKGSKAEKGHGQPPRAAAESPTKAAKKKKAESPRLGHSTFSKLFRHKVGTNPQQSPEHPEQQPVTSVKSDKTLPPSQELPKQNPKSPEAAAPQQGPGTETPREGVKEKAAATPLPLSKLFWKKNSSEEAEAVGNERAEVSLEVVAPERDESKNPEPSEVKLRGAESKTPKANLRKFFKLTLNATERPVAPAEGEPVGQKSKESSKDKKSTVELSKKGSKQESREQPEPREQAADSDSIHNGGDASKEPSYKKTEKRQSLGGFLKGL